MLIAAAPSRNFAANPAWHTWTLESNLMGMLMLDGKVAIVTGAGRGLGRAIAVALAEQGARLMLHGRSPAPLEELARELGGKDEAAVVTGDVGDEATWGKMTRATLDRFGRIDILINNAGIMGGGAALADIPVSEFDAVMRANVRGTWLGMAHCVPHMLQRGEGCIVNLSSIHGLHGNAGQAAYSASKHAVIGLTKTGAIEYARHGIRVNAVCPAAHETEMFADFRARFTDEQWAERIAAKYPVGRVGKPEEVAALVVFLCSGGASNLHGLAIPIDGGYAAQ